MVAYTKPQQRKKEEREKLRGESDQIKFIDLRFEKWQIVRFRKVRRQDVPKMACSTLSCTMCCICSTYIVALSCAVFDLVVQCCIMTYCIMYRILLHSGSSLYNLVLPSILLHCVI